MASFPQSLIGLAPFVDACCRVLFTDTAVIAFDRDGKVILEGWRETTGPKLWHWPLLAQVPPPPDLPKAQLQLGPCAYGTQMLGCIPFLYSGSCWASFSGICFFLRNPRNSAKHTSELNHSRARLICSGIRRNPEFWPEFRREGPLAWYSVPRVTNIH
jgi:hypothetical protein